MQGLANLGSWERIMWTEQMHDPETGEWLMDTFLVPTQWHPDPDSPSSEELAKAISQERREVLRPFFRNYEVVFTPSGVRCNCEWAHLHADPQTGSCEDRPCAHIEIARVARAFGLLSPLSG